MMITCILYNPIHHLAIVHLRRCIGLALVVRSHHQRCMILHFYEFNSVRFSKRCCLQCWQRGARHAHSFSERMGAHVLCTSQKTKTQNTNIFHDLILSLYGLRMPVNACSPPTGLCFFDESLMTFDQPNESMITIWMTCALYTARCTLCTIHCTMWTVHCTLYTVHCTLHNVHWALCIVHCTLYTVHCALYTVHFTLHTAHCTLYTVHYTLYTAHTILYIVHSTLHDAHCVLYTVHCALCIVHCNLYTTHSTLCIVHCTLHTVHWALYIVGR